MSNSLCAHCDPSQTRSYRYNSSMVIALFLHTVHSLSKNPIGDEGFCTIVDALIAKPGTLKELGSVFSICKMDMYQIYDLLQC